MTILLAAAHPIDDWGPSVGWLQGLGNIANIPAMRLADNPCGALTKFADVMSMVVGLLTVIAGLYFVFTLITGALAWLTAGGDKMGTENAQKRITHGLVGLVIIIAAIFIIDIIGKILGIDLLTPGKFIEPSCYPVS